jgi:hypothetical protein
MLTGVLIGESLRVGAKLGGGLPLRLNWVTNVESGEGAVDGQPARWTVFEFEADDETAAELAGALARCLDTGPWYANFNTAEEAFVIFADRVFRYRRGDRSGRARAAQYARTVGVPEAQLDWSD